MPFRQAAAEIIDLTVSEASQYVADQWHSPMATENQAPRPE